VIKSELVGTGRLKHFWVMESLALIGEIPVSMEAKLLALRSSLGSDGVHLTDIGFNHLFRKMSQAMSKVLDRMEEAKKLRNSESVASLKVSGASFYWRGFISARGSIRRPETSRGGRSGPGGGGGNRGGGGRGGGGRGSRRLLGFGGSFAGGPSSRGARSGKPYDRVVTID